MGSSHSPFITFVGAILRLVRLDIVGHRSGRSKAVYDYFKSKNEKDYSLANKTVQYLVRR